MRILLTVFVVLSFVPFLTAGEIDVSGTVKSAVDSSALNGQVTVTVGTDSTVLPVTDGYYSGSITGIKKNEAALPKFFNLKVYPSVLTSAQHTITARISAPRKLKKQDLRMNVYNLLGQKVDISRAVSFHPLIIRARSPFGSQSRRVLAAGPFELVTVLKDENDLPGLGDLEGLSLPKTAGDSVDAIFKVNVEGYQTLIDTIKLTVSGPNENDFYLDPVLQDYILSGRVTDEAGEPVDSAMVLARIASVVDTVFTDNGGFWTSDTVKSYDLSEEASVDVFKEDYKDWASGVFDINPGETVVDATLESNLRVIGGEIFNQRGKYVNSGIVRLLYNGTEKSVDVVDGVWNTELPKDVESVKFLLDNPDYTNRFLAIQKPGQRSDEYNIGQAALVGPWDTPYMDTARVDLTLPDNIITNLQVYLVADSAINDTVKQIIDGPKIGVARWVFPYTVEILTKDPSDGGIVPQDRTDSRIRIVEDYLSRLTLENGKLLITVDYVVHEESQPTEPRPPNWVRMYRDNSSGPGHLEWTWPDRGSAIMYARNTVNSSTTLNTVGSEFHGNHFRSDPESMTLGSYILNSDGTLNKMGISMLFIYLFDEGTRFRQ